MSTNLPGITIGASNYQSVIGIFFTNGTFIKYFSEFTGNLGGNIAGIKYHAASRQFFVVNAMIPASGYSIMIGSILANRSARVLINDFTYQFTVLTRNFDVSSSEIVIGGSDGFAQAALSGVRYFLTNFTVNQQWSYTNGFGAEVIGVSFDVVNNYAYMTGHSDGLLPALPPAVGNGSLIVLQWNLNNGTVSCLARYGGNNFIGQSGLHAGSGVQYDASSGIMVVSALLPTSFTKFGNQGMSATLSAIHNE